MRKAERLACSCLLSGLISGLLSGLLVAAAARAQTPASPSPPAAPSLPPLPSPWAESPEAALMRLLGQSPSPTSAVADAALTAGTVRVSIVDERDQPVANAAVDVGMMAKGGGGAQRWQARTDALGLATFRGLPVGASQAYRVNLPQLGPTQTAKLSSAPFQLPPDKGFAVRIVRLPTTQDEGVLLQSFGQTALEFRDERLHVVQSSQLVNLSGRLFVFGSAGKPLGLPQGFTALQVEKQMGDQRLIESPTGMTFYGSLPPGTTTLRWAFDLPLSGSELRLSQPMPWRTHVYQVVAAASPGMQLQVAGLPPAEWRSSEAGRFLGTQIERQPSSAPFDRLRIHLTGIPGPGPWRWLAVALAALLGLLLPLWLLRRGGTPTQTKAGNETAGDSAGQTAEEQRLLRAIAELEAQRRQQQVGEAYAERRRRELTDELAALLRATKGQLPVG